MHNNNVDVVIECYPCPGHGAADKEFPAWSIPIEWTFCLQGVLLPVLIEETNN